MRSDSVAFVDTNVFVYAYGQGDPAKKRIAFRLIAELMDAGSLRTSIQVLQELYVTLRRKMGVGPEQAWEQTAALAEWPVFSPVAETIGEAALLAEGSILSFWDALIVVAAARSGARTLYTEDLNHGQALLGVEVVNPFAADA